MPVVPNVPGVPALTSYAPNSLSLLVTDALSAIAGLLAPSWGIFVEGQPVITPASIIGQQIETTLGAISQVAALIGLPNVVPVSASMVSFEYAGDTPISNYPQERGAFQSYDKVQLPFDVRVKLACSGTASSRQAFFSTLEAIKNSTVLVDVVTPEAIYAGVNCKHVDYIRRSDRGVTLVVADVWFEEVREVAASSFTNTQQPTDAGPQSIGNVQPQDATPVAQQVALLGGKPY